MNTGIMTGKIMHRSRVHQSIREMLAIPDTMRYIGSNGLSALCCGMNSTIFNIKKNLEFPHG
jgi:hypothetical protein